MPQSQDLWQLVNGYRLSQALSVAATLGIADLLAEGPRTTADLAAQTDTHPDSLYRLLRALASIGVLHEDNEKRFSLLPLGESLRSDRPGSIRSWAEFIGRRHHWDAWGELLHSIRTGENASRHVHGTDVWDFRAKHPEEGSIFDAAMAALTRRLTATVLEAYDFGRFRMVVDVGGGDGALLAALLDANPTLNGLLFDQPHVVANATVPERCRAVGGSFFDVVPEGGDAYVLKSIIHDWEDEEAIAILRTCRRAMTPQATLLVIERIIGEPNEDAATKFSDLNMLVAAGGRERTVMEYEALFAAAGLRLGGVYGEGAVNVIEAVPER